MNAAQFKDPLTVTELVKDWRKWRLEQELVYRDIRVPVGYITDGASVPRPLWWLLPSWGRYSRASVVHDYLCDQIVKRAPHPAAPTARKADAIFYQAMKDSGVNATIRWLMWAAVRLAGILGLRETSHIAP